MCFILVTISYVWAFNKCFLFTGHLKVLIIYFVNAFCLLYLLLIKKNQLFFINVLVM